MNTRGLDRRIQAKWPGVKGETMRPVNLPRRAFWACTSAVSQGCVGKQQGHRVRGWTSTLWSCCSSSDRIPAAWLLFITFTALPSLNCSVRKHEDRHCLSIGFVMRLFLSFQNKSISIKGNCSLLVLTIIGVKQWYKWLSFLAEFVKNYFCFMLVRVCLLSTMIVIFFSLIKMWKQKTNKQKKNSFVQSTELVTWPSYVLSSDL